MFAILHVLWIFVVDIFKSRRRLEAENLFLHHQLNIALRRAPARLRLYGSDRALLVWMTRIWPGLLDISRVVKPETILRWHRSGFKAFWRWKSRNRAGRPKVDRELRRPHPRMNKENPLWGAPRMANCRCWGSKSPSRRSPNTWCRVGGHLRNPGGRLFETTWR